MNRQQLPAWQALQTHAAEIKPQHLSALFEADAQRFTHFSRQQSGLLADFSKQRITQTTLQHLKTLAETCQLPEAIDALFRGDKVNLSEQRAAKHWSLRLPANERSTEVSAELDKMQQLVALLRAGQWRGARGDAITDVVNIGVGGSDLGPRMTSYALRDFAADSPHSLRVHFASSMDGSQIAQLRQRLYPGSTLFIVSSKSFSTTDTLHNAGSARQWLVNHLGDEATVLRCHFIGVSSKPDKMTAWGIPTSNQLHLWDWVGGRFSLWSAIGLPIALTLGMDGFRDLLAGAARMDRHFRTTNLADNIPVLMALLDVWNVDFLGIGARTILPYDGRLRYLPAYFEQLEMESNGKSVGVTGEPLEHNTCPVIWGEIGPNAQHAFYQLLHQGSHAVACDFIVPAKRDYPGGEEGDELARQHQLALANSLAQSRLLAFGDQALETPLTEPWRQYRGNQPSNMLLLDALSPANLGALIALYEHKVYASATIWGNNPFDQWGVEMGKKIAEALLPQVGGNATTATSLDSSTKGLIAAIKHQSVPSNER